MTARFTYDGGHFSDRYVQEYDAECPAPNTNRTYISYVDGGHFYLVASATFTHDGGHFSQVDSAAYLPCTFPVPSLYLPCTFTGRLGRVPRYQARGRAHASVPCHH